MVTGIDWHQIRIWWLQYYILFLMALLKNASPNLRLNKQLSNPPTSPQNANLAKVFQTKKEAISSPSPGKPMGGLHLLKYKQTSTPTINIPAPNKPIQNSHQFTHKKQPTLDNLNSISNLKIKTQNQKLSHGQKSNTPSIVLNTSQSNEPPSPTTPSTIPGSATNLSRQSKPVEPRATPKAKKMTPNPEQINNLSITFNQYGLYVPEKSEFEEGKPKPAKAGVGSQLKKILHQSGGTPKPLPKTSLKDDLYQLKLDIEKTKERIHENAEISWKLSRSAGSKNEFEKPKVESTKHLRPPNKQLKVSTGRGTAPNTPRESEKRKASFRLEEVRQLKGIAEFQLGKCVGNGKFGDVHIARHKKTGFIVAIKRIPKSMIRQYKLENQIATEIKHQFFATHPSVVQLYGFFDDETYIYLVMECMPDGTLFALLHKRKKLEEAEVAYILLEICHAICYLHNNKIAHRDIKPENIVLSYGFSKICDFGWSAKMMNPRKTYCGTLDYAPPQILERKEYSESVDLWCLGVLAFQLLTGKVPFSCEDRKQMTKKIINVEQQRFTFPPQVSQNARDLIDNLVRKNPQERMRASDILEHEFIKSYTRSSNN